MKPAHTSWTFGLAALALALPATANTAPETLDLALLAMDDAPGSLSEALFSGEAALKFRFRYEEVDQDPNPDNAHAATLRTELTYKTLAYEGFSGLVQFEHTSILGDDAFNDGTGSSTRPAVVDPKGADLNQAFINYDLGDHGLVRLGRQEVVMDNARFIGNVGWRQNHQSYDGITYHGGESLPFGMAYGYVENVNRIFGDAAANGDLRTAAHMLNISKDFENIGKATAYLYALDIDAAPALSTMTMGARLAGDLEVSDDFVMDYLVEFATQDDYGDNAMTSYSADYYRVELGGDVGGFQLGLGQELLGSDGGAAGFSTPLATLHAHNGWADQFLGTPADGLEDTFFRVATKVNEVGLMAVFHDYAADNGGADYGTELDFSAKYKLNANMTCGLKYADYSADTWKTDTNKVWFWLTWTP